MSGLRKPCRPCSSLWCKPSTVRLCVKRIFRKSPCPKTQESRRCRCQLHYWDAEIHKIPFPENFFIEKMPFPENLFIRKPPFPENFGSKACAPKTSIFSGIYEIFPLSAECSSVCRQGSCRRLGFCPALLAVTFLLSSNMDEYSTK